MRITPPEPRGHRYNDHQKSERTKNASTRYTPKTNPTIINGRTNEIATIGRPEEVETDNDKDKDKDNNKHTKMIKEPNIQTTITHNRNTTPLSRNNPCTHHRSPARSINPNHSSFRGYSEPTPNPEASPKRRPTADTDDAPSRPPPTSPTRP